MRTYTQSQWQYATSPSSLRARRGCSAPLGRFVDAAVKEGCGCPGEASRLLGYSAAGTRRVHAREGSPSAGRRTLGQWRAQWAISPLTLCGAQV